MTAQCRTRMIGMSLPRMAVWIVAILFATASFSVAWCQLPSFPLPTSNGVLGTKDAAALAEVTASISAASSGGWRDLIATGTLTYPAGDSHAATLYLLGSRYSRLDIQTDNMTRSVRVGDTLGSFLDKSGRQNRLLPTTARMGIVAFPRLWKDALNLPQFSLVDCGMYTGNGQTLHRITMEYQLTTGSFRPGDPTVATDLYFDPTSHVLLYSVDSLSFVISAGQPFLRVTGYSKFQVFDGITLPSVIQESLNGQLQWSLQLSQVSMNTNPALGTFSF